MGTKIQTSHTSYRYRCLVCSHDLREHADAASLATDFEGGRAYYNVCDCSCVLARYAWKQLMFAATYGRTAQDYRRIAHD